MIPAPAYVAPADYPQGHKLALVALSRGPLRDAVVRSLAEMHAPEPTPADYAELRSLGYVTAAGRRALTPRGAFVAGVILRDYGKRHKLHVVEMREGIGRGHSATCPCGFTAFARRTRNGRSSLEIMVAQHLAQVRNGTLPAAYQ